MPGSVTSAVGAATRKIGVFIGATALFFALTDAALGHDIYSSLSGKHGWLRCGANDCAATIYRENGGRFEFLTRENEWIEIPIDHITFCRWLATTLRHVR